MKKKQDLEEVMKCVWRKLAEDGLSTTFEQVKELSYDNPLWKCKYNCNGYDFGCNGYRVVKRK